jgi:putative transposase
MLMTDYRRPWVEGGTYFFTVNLAERRENRLLVDNVALLRDVFRKVKQAHPFEIDAIVVLPEHLHCIWTLPADDANYALRWGLIKAGFSRLLPDNERRTESRTKRGERGVWQRRYWEHLIRDERDFNKHMDYIHWNPVKHGWVMRVRDWPYSSFHGCVERGLYPADWAGADEEVVEVGEWD